MSPSLKRLSLIGLMLVAGCASLPTGPSVMALPGSRKTFDVFRVDDRTGLISEHWDSSERWDSSGRPPGAEFFP